MRLDSFSGDLVEVLNLLLSGFGDSEDYYEDFAWYVFNYAQA